VNQLADSKGFLEDPTQVGLQVVSQKIRSSRSADASGASAIISESVLIRAIRAIRGSKFPVSDFSAEGPVLQARGLPKSDLVRALLTNETRACREQSDKNPVNSVNPVKNVFGFRLRAHLDWRNLVNLEKRDSSLEKEIELIWKRNPIFGFWLQVLYCDSLVV